MRPASAFVVHFGSEWIDAFCSMDGTVRPSLFANDLFPQTSPIFGVTSHMPKKRFNIWMDTSLIKQIKAAAKAVGLNKVSTYCRVACLEKMRRDNESSTPTIRAAKP